MLKRLLPTFAVAALLAACASGPPPPPPWTPAGMYDVGIDAQGMQIAGVLTITNMDGEYSGSLSTDMGSVDLYDFVINDHEVAFMGTSPDFSLAFALVIQESGELNGEIEVAGMGTAFISGTKRPSMLPQL